MKAMQGKDKLFLVIAFLMTVVALVGCATPAETTPEATTEPVVEPTAEPVEPTAEPQPTEGVKGATPDILTLPEQIAGGRDVSITVSNMPAESQPELLANWNEQVARFEAMYPNVKIVGDPYNFAPDTFPPLVAAGQVPTLFAAYLTEPSKFVSQGIVVDLTDVFAAQGLDKVFNPEIVNVAKVDGKIYGIPREAYAMGLAYNIDLLKAAGYDEPPTTWDEAVEMAKKLTNRDAGVAGLSMITDGANAGGWHLTTLAYTFGLQQMDVVAPGDAGYKANFNNDAMLGALNTLSTLRWDADVLPRENLAWDTNGQALATGKAAMAVMAGQQFSWIKENYADVDLKQFGLAPLPAGPNGQSASLVGGYLNFVSAAATEDEQEAAIYFQLWRQLDSGEIKINLDNSVKDTTVVVGTPMLPLYVGDFQKAFKAQDDGYANLPVENYVRFNDAVAAGDVKIIPEPIVAAQDYYAIVGALASKVITTQLAESDIQAALQQAVDDYQTNVLDLLELK